MAWDLSLADAKRREAEEAAAAQAHVETHWSEVRTERGFLERSRRRKPGALRAQEKYVRDDIPCGIAQCSRCMGKTRPLAPHQRPLQKENAEYIVPDAFALLQCMELLEEPVFGDIAPHLLVLETVWLEALRIAPSRDATRLKNYMRDSRRAVASTVLYVFPDQHHLDTFTEPTWSTSDEAPMESMQARDARAVLNTLSWYIDGRHVRPSSRVLFMAQDAEHQLCKQLRSQLKIEVVTCEGFLDQRLTKKRHPSASFMHELAQNTADAVLSWQERRHGNESNATIANAEFQPHLPTVQLEALVARGHLLSGKFEVNPHCALEAFVIVDRSCSSSVDKVFVYGREDLNRGIHGDQVVVQLLPEEEWRCPVGDRLLIHFASSDDVIDGERRGGKDNSQNSVAAAAEKPIPTGYVVGILARSSRFHVATVLSNTVSANDDYALAIPMDVRIPKVRIRSQRMDTLVDKRLKVVIDHWPIDSMYPQGHYVGVLGSTGNLSTEMSALLVRNEIEDAPFSESALACLPECDIEGNCIAECSTAKRPAFCDLLDWPIPIEEMNCRRDLRTSHRVFSVDPPGCQDIDDAMSVRMLPNGNIELGVHIADVSYFVAHESPLDYEARSRATTVYLVGQRLDMLPSVLSADLCSLHENVDRLAISVIWELDSESLDVVEGATWFGRTIIRSQSSMTYEQAHRMLQGVNADGGKPKANTRQSSISKSEWRRGVAGGDIPLKLQDELRKDLNLLTDIGRNLERVRSKHGGLDLSKHEELRFSLNVTELGNGVEIIVKGSLEIHHTIAELMILANSYVAKRIFDTFPSNALLRRHAPPSGDRFRQLIKIAQARDIVIDATNNYTLQQSLMHADASGNVDNKTMSLLKSLAVRVMSEAEYICASDAEAVSDSNGDVTAFAHYGLGVQFYTHFTSPIRRYADVIVHRQLLAALDYVQQTKTLGVDANQRRQVQALPHSLVTSVLEDGDDLLDDLISTVDSKLHTETVVDDSASEEEINLVVFPPQELVPLSKHLNKKNRNAKSAARDCDELFLALYFSSHTMKVPAIITSLKENGFIVYVPKYDLRAPVYIATKEGIVQMNPLLCGVRIVDTFPPTGVFAQAECIRSIPQARAEYDLTADRLHVSVPNANGKCSFQILDEVEVQISCDLSASAARVPQLQLLLVGRVNQYVAKPREMVLTTNKADSSIPELQRIVQKTNQNEQKVTAERPSMATDGSVKPCEKDLYDLFLSPLSYISPTNKITKKRPQLKQKKPSTPAKEECQVLMKKRGPGRLIFGNYSPPERQHFQQKLAHYMDQRSTALEEELQIQRYGGVSAMGLQEMKRAEREAMTRTMKLASEKRHDRINSRKKAGN